MAKTKYKFNPESLSYDKVDSGFKEKLKSLIPYMLSVFGGTIALYAVFTFFIDSPKEKMLKRENEKLKLQYELMNKEISGITEVLQDLQYRDDNIYRTIFGKKPIAPSIRKAGFGGVNRYSDLEGYNSSDLLIETAKKLDIVTKQLYIQSKSFDEIATLAGTKKDMLTKVPAIQPILNRNLTRIASFYGYRIDPVYKTRKFHHGIDFTAPVGTDIYATGDGVVVEVKKSRAGYGNRVVIDHGFGYKTRYAHMSRMFVKKGQKVKRGEVIGHVGNTGKSVGPHLHYEVLKNDHSVDPINYYFLDLSPEDYDKMIELSAQGGQSLD